MVNFSKKKLYRMFAPRRARRKVTNKGIITFLIILGIVLGVSAFFSSDTPRTLALPVTVTIEEGASGSQIAQQLKDADLIRSKWMFQRYIEREGIAEKLRPGTYTFEGKVNFEVITAQLLQGKQKAGIEVTIPEGYSVKEIAALLASKGLTTEAAFLNYCEEGQFQYDYLPPVGTENRLEGFLFPDTYMIDESWTEKEIVGLLLAQFDKVWSDEYRERAQELDMDTLDVITLASIIEREARVASDRPLISSVFHNRLDTHMALQSCATIQYILGKQKDKLTDADLEIQSPYNTYQNAGLPPGPICSPGEASIEAALYPADTEYYYFLAKPDGSHYFSKTYEEHLAAKKKYID